MHIHPWNHRSQDNKHSSSCLLPLWSLPSCPPPQATWLLSFISNLFIFSRILHRYNQAVCTLYTQVSSFGIIILRLINNVYQESTPFYCRVAHRHMLISLHSTYVHVDSSLGCSRQQGTRCCADLCSKCSWVNNLEIKWLGHNSRCFFFFNYSWKCQIFSQIGCSIYSPTSSVWEFQFLLVLTNTYYVQSF